MYQLIDNFNDFSTWTKSDIELELSNETINTFDNSTDSVSMKFYVPTDKNGQSISKIYLTPISLIGFSELRFQIASKNFSSLTHTKTEHFKISIELSDSSNPTVIYKWYIPLVIKSKFQCIAINIDGIDQIDTITFRIVDLLAESNTYWLDYMIICKPEMEFDLLTAITEKLDEKIEIELGVLKTPALINDLSIELNDIGFITANSKIKISEGSIIEYHQVLDEPVNGIVQFTQLLDGDKILNNFSIAANVSLIVPANFKNNTKEIFLPSYTVWGFTPERALENETEAKEIFNYRITNSQFKATFEKIFNFILSVDINCTAWHLELIQIMNEKLRSVFDSDVFFHVLGCETNYDVTNKIFEFGINDEIPHMSVFSINFYVSEFYNRGIEQTFPTLVNSEINLLEV